jgi:hypothetical protein
LAKIPCSCAAHKLNALLLTDATPRLTRTGALAAFKQHGNSSLHAVRNKTNRVTGKATNLNAGLIGSLAAALFGRIHHWPMTVFIELTTSAG